MESLLAAGRDHLDLTALTTNCVSGSTVPANPIVWSMQCSAPSFLNGSGESSGGIAAQAAENGLPFAASPVAFLLSTPGVPTQKQRASS